ncbi:MAG: ABC transporter transmembrane domain-containing protein, partial [Limisphaerales bacterium]
MPSFLFKVWDLARPYRTRLFLGVTTGVASGLLSPLMIAAVMFVYGAVFPSPDANGRVQLPMNRMPHFAQTWFENASVALKHGLHSHPWTIAAVIVTIPAIMLLRGIFGYMNVYFLQWTASRTIADLRTRLFAHLLNLSAGFYNENSSGQLISRVMNDTAALQNILSSATSVIVRDPVTLISVLG